LKEPEWPTEIARVIDNVAEEKAQSRLDDEFERRVNEGAWRRFQEFKRTEWQPFLEAEASRIGFNLKTLVAERQGIWHFDCDRCQRRVTMDSASRQIASLLRGEQVAECPQCKDFNLPPAAPIAPHKIKGSALADMVEAYVAGKGPP